MSAVSNTSPLRYLIAVGQADLLFQLFGEVLIPPGVATELSHASAPLAIRQWMVQPQNWLRVHVLNSQPDAELQAALDPGEREAIQLATERSTEVLIMDEWKGRSIVHTRGLPLIGALGVLGEAYRRELIDNPLEILADMRRQGFRINDELVARFKTLLHTRYGR